MTADQNGRSGHQAAAQHAVEFLHAAADAWHFGQIHIGQALNALRAGRPGIAAEAGVAGRGFGRRDDKFLQGIPGTTIAALALPFAVVRAAIGADVGGFFLGHNKHYPELVTAT